MESNIKQRPISQMIKNISGYDKNIVANCLEKCENPTTLTELFDYLHENIDKAKYGFTIVRYIDSEETFSLILDLMDELRDCDAVILGFEAVRGIPHDFEIETKYVRIITKIIQNNERADVVYYGIKLFYKMTRVNPIIANFIRKNCSLDLNEVTISILKKGLKKIKDMENSLKDNEYPMRYMFTCEDFYRFSHLIRGFDNI